jgi:kynureninase
MKRITDKQFLLTGYLEFLLSKELSKVVKIITPKNPKQRGSQLSLQFNLDIKETHAKLKHQGIVVHK